LLLLSPLLPVVSSRQEYSSNLFTRNGLRAAAVLLRPAAVAAAAAEKVCVSIYKSGETSQGAKGMKPPRFLISRQKKKKRSRSERGMLSNSCDGVAAK